MNTHKNVGISVIIPTYNAEMYLSECLASLMERIPTNSEIIIVVDGFTDNSQVVCDEFFDHHIDQSIQIVVQETSGANAARSRGLSLATKDYICFLD